MLQAKFYENECKSTTSFDMAHFSHYCWFFWPYYIYLYFEVKGHWLLSDALNSTIFMSLKFKAEIDFATFDNLMEKDENVVYELSCLASHIKK